MERFGLTLQDLPFKSGAPGTLSPAPSQYEAQLESWHDFDSSTTDRHDG